MTTHEDTSTTTGTSTTQEAPSVSDDFYVILGSSVTYGSASGGYSFAEALRDTYHCRILKQAVSGTTLVDNGAESYVQLSTNDASQKNSLGVLTADNARELRRLIPQR